MTDTISLLPQAGERTDDISASVQSDKIYIQDIEHQIQTGDQIERVLKNGMVETYDVLRADYYERMRSHIEVVVKKK